VFNISSGGDGGYVLAVGNDGQLAGLVVDRIVGLREIVVHPVSDPLVALPGIAGATELPHGRVSLIIDAAAIAMLDTESLAIFIIASPRAACCCNATRPKQWRNLPRHVTASSAVCCVAQQERRQGGRENGRKWGI
jgi:chemotaxis protein histidine kinase CheA